MSNINVMRKNLGPVTAYKYAVQHGYTGTEQEFAALMASYAIVAEEASESAANAAASASAAAESARTLTIDGTLTQLGQAADAKATGDKIGEVKDSIVYQQEYVGAQKQYYQITGTKITLNDTEFPFASEAGETFSCTPDGTALADGQEVNIYAKFSGDDTRTRLSVIVKGVKATFTPNRDVESLAFYQTNVSAGTFEVAIKRENPEILHKITTKINEVEDKADALVDNDQNLFDYRNLSNFGFASGVIVSGDDYISYVFPVRRGETYTITRRSTGVCNRFRVAFTTEEPAESVAIYNTNGNQQSPTSIGDTLTTQTVTVPSKHDYTYAVIYLSNSGQEIDDSSKIMIVRDSQAHPWEPYYGGLGAKDIVARKKISKITGTGIVALNNWTETIIRLQQMNRPNRWPSSSLNTPPLVLLHFSDIHDDAENMDRIAEYADEYSSYIDDVVCTGDIVNTVYTQGIALFDVMPNALQVIGNHDTRVGTDYHGLDENDTYTNYFAPYIENWGVQSTEGKCYYYKDYADNNVRLIALDYMHQSAEQLTWFADALAGAKTNQYTVVVCIHDAPEGLTSLETQFNSQVLTEYWDTHRDSRFDMLSDDYPDAVDTFIGGGGKFACWLTGHTHFNIFAQLTDHPDQIAIAVSNAGIIHANSSDADRQAGTKSQDCFNIVAIDDYSSLVKIMRVGCDYTRWMKHPTVVCWDFVNKKFMS